MQQYWTITMPFFSNTMRRSCFLTGFALLLLVLPTRWAKADLIVNFPDMGQDALTRAAHTELFNASNTARKSVACKARVPVGLSPSSTQGKEHETSAVDTAAVRGIACYFGLRPTCVPTV